VRIKEVADFIVTSINGRPPCTWRPGTPFPRAIERQLNAYIRMLRA
jgi:hypothetical protein